MTRYPYFREAAPMRAEMHARGLSQTSVAVRCGMSQPQIQRYLAGKKQPWVSTVTRLALAIGMDPMEALRPYVARAVREHEAQLAEEQEP